MPTLRRILKYTPAVVMGLLVVAWVVNAFGILCYQRHFGNQLCSVSCGSGAFGVLSFTPRRPYQAGLLWASYSENQIFNSDGTDPGTWRQRFAGLPLIHWKADADRWGLNIQIPMVCLLTAFLPLAIGPFLSFRFSLWHYLAYTALIAVELAYYLRWQR